MAKASLTLPNGTLVKIEGTVEEVQSLLSFYGMGKSEKSSFSKVSDKPVVKNPAIQSIASVEKPSDKDLYQIVNTTKTCIEAVVIERNILDEPNEANRVLLPLYIIHEYLGNKFGLTTGEISKITIELGTKVSRQNVLRALKFSANRFVIKQGNPPRYILNRRGVSHIKTTLSGSGDKTENVQTAAITLTPKKTKRKSRSTSNKNGPTKFILQLIETNYFAEKRSISDIQKKLEELGHLYAQTSLSSPLLNLVRGKKLKRFKENNLWYYMTE